MSATATSIFGAGLAPSPAASPVISPGSPPAPRKRSKVSRACDACRKKKIRCDANPDEGRLRCSSCCKAGVDCCFCRVPLKRGPSKGQRKDTDHGPPAAADSARPVKPEKPPLSAAATAAAARHNKPFRKRSFSITCAALAHNNVPADSPSIAPPPPPPQPQPPATTSSSTPLPSINNFFAGARPQHQPLEPSRLLPHIASLGSYHYPPRASPGPPAPPQPSPLHHHPKNYRPYPHPQQHYHAQSSPSSSTTLQLPNLLAAAAAAAAARPSLGSPKSAEPPAHGSSSPHQAQRSPQAAHAAHQKKAQLEAQPQAAQPQAHDTAAYPRHHQQQLLQRSAGGHVSRSNSVPSYLPSEHTLDSGSSPVLAPEQSPEDDRPAKLRRLNPTPPQTADDPAAVLAAHWDDKAIDTYYQVIHPTLPLLPPSKLKLRAWLLAAAARRVPAPLRAALLAGISGLALKYSQGQGRGPQRHDALNIHQSTVCAAVTQTLASAETPGDGRRSAVFVVLLVLMFLFTDEALWLSAAVSVAYSLDMHQPFLYSEDEDDKDTTESDYHMISGDEDDAWRGASSSEEDDANAAGSSSSGDDLLGSSGDETPLGRRRQDRKRRARRQALARFSLGSASPLSRSGGARSNPNACFSLEDRTAHARRLFHVLVLLDCIQSSLYFTPALIPESLIHPDDDGDAELGDGDAAPAAATPPPPPASATAAATTTAMLRLCLLFKHAFRFRQKALYQQHLWSQRANGGGRSRAAIVRAGLDELHEELGRARAALEGLWDTTPVLKAMHHCVAVSVLAIGLSLAAAAPQQASASADNAHYAASARMARTLAELEALLGSPLICVSPLAAYFARLAATNLCRLAGVLRPGPAGSDAEICVHAWGGQGGRPQVSAPAAPAPAPATPNGPSRQYSAQDVATLRRTVAELLEALAAAPVWPRLGAPIAARVDAALRTLRAEDPRRSPSPRTAPPQKVSAQAAWPQQQYAPALLSPPAFAPGAGYFPQQYNLKPRSPPATASGASTSASPPSAVSTPVSCASLPQQQQSQGPVPYYGALRRSSGASSSGSSALDHLASLAEKVKVL